MSRLRISCLLLILMLTAVAVCADIIPGGEAKRPPLKFYSSLQLTVGNVPKGMVLILLGDKNDLLQTAKNDEVITVSRQCTLYLAQKADLSKPFNYGNDRKKLIKLRQYGRDDIHSSPGPPPNPVPIHGMLHRLSGRKTTAW